MMLYYFTELKYAFDDIKNHHIKVATLDSINDPYEWVPCVINEDNKPYPAEQIREWMCKRYKNKYGFLCLSSSISNPALWGYYGNNHNGAAFGFEFEDNELPPKMNYCNERVIYNPVALQDDVTELNKYFTKLIQRKAKTWEHEEEYRMIVDIDKVCENINGLWFGSFLELRLKTVVLGCRCSYYDLVSMKAELSSAGFNNVCVQKTTIDATSFLMKLV